MSKHIYITRQINEIGINMLREKGYHVDISKKDRPLHKDEIKKELSKKKYDAVICLLTDHIDKEIFKACPTAKIFANYAVGYNNINLNDAKKAGVTITNCRGTSAHAVAEFTVGLILSLSARIVEGDLFVRKGKYKGWKPDLFLGEDLFGKTIGLVGSGSIGSLVAEFLHKGFNCKICYSDVVKNPVVEAKCNAEHISLEEVLKNSDIISVHTPLLPSTKHLINKKNIKHVKDGAILINTARGPVVEEVAMIEALEKGKLRGVGLDVYEFEPEVNKKLMKMTNTVLTPHIASARDSARNEMSELCAKNIISFFEKNRAITEVK